VYGVPASPLVDEDTPCAPINPYGASKLAAERAWRTPAARTAYAPWCLRYFNVAGADPPAAPGSAAPAPPTSSRWPAKRRSERRPWRSFGTDYPTPDGTGVRDYIHVTDLARAHVEALRHLMMGGGSLTLNCGYGRGHSVLEVLRAVERASGRRVPARLAPRRPGDPPALIARADRVRDALGWRPAFDDLDRIVSSALAWESRLRSPPPKVAEAAAQLQA
jgi:UDP-glucose 4-epimerase